MPEQPNNESERSEQLASVFEERAENLSKAELEQWSALTARDVALLSKLKGPGSKLLTGPRGSGKSTLLRKAYYELLDEGEALPVYVNYSRALALEPLFHTHSNALQLFRQWVLFKMILGFTSTMSELGREMPNDLNSLAVYGKSFVRILEIGEPPTSIENAIAPSELLSKIEGWIELFGYRRCVLLLDDAAHAFSPDQQQQFFEIFREIRSRRVAGKAAVYPGITSYSPYFHVGHEAELLEAWYRPDEDDYLETMRSIVSRRLPRALGVKLEGRDEIVDLLAFASFGLPRGFLNMLSQVLRVDEEQHGQPTRRDAELAIQDHAESVRRIFQALSSKLPRFKHFIEIGRELESSVVRLLREFNLARMPQRKAVVFAVQEPIGQELDRILKFLEYAGIVRPLGTVSRGIKGVFQRYSLHYSVLITENALSLGRSFPLSAVIESLRNRDSHAFVRGKGATYLGANFEKRCTLEMPPCPKCNASRIAAEQRFCMQCGAELTNVSVYEDLLNAPIERLPLTRQRVQRIKEHTDLRTVQDILLDDELQTIRKVPYIGAVWAARIRTYAEEFVSV